eukprot:COSAG06_NODE_68127_length_239_cov_1.950000_1_plen_26_part_10
MFFKPGVEGAGPLAKYAPQANFFNIC